MHASSYAVVLFFFRAYAIELFFWVFNFSMLPVHTILISNCKLSEFFQSFFEINLRFCKIVLVDIQYLYLGKEYV